jgi:hypothetical protein
MKGRPKGPEKVVYKRRVLPELIPKLDGVLEGAAPDPGVPMDVLMRLTRESKTYAEFHQKLESKDWTLTHQFPHPVPATLTKGDNASTGLGTIPMPTFQAAADKVFKERSELMWKLAVSEKEDQIKALLEDVSNAVGEIEALKAELELERSKNLDQKASWWRMRYLELEKKVKDSSDFSQ